MRRLAPLLAMIFSAVAVSGQAGEKREVFKYSAQLGVAEVRATGEGCLAIQNPGLQEKQSITLVILDKPQIVVRTSIVKKLKTSCSRNTETPPGASFYAIPASEDFDPAIAVVGSTGAFPVVNGEVRGDLNGDGTAESFRSCTSNEGLHLTVWSGEVLRTERLWHEYYYLGYDVEPSCAPQDYQE